MRVSAKYLATSIEIFRFVFNFTDRVAIAIVVAMSMKFQNVLYDI